MSAYPLSRTIQHKIDMMLMRKHLQRKNWTFSDKRLRVFLAEMDQWLEHYHPVDLRGKTVLDIGAGEGETAEFFIRMGAARVISIEPELQAFKLLKVNAAAHPQIQPVRSFFRPEHLWLDHDFMKMDIEGYEEQLLGLDLPKPAVIEVHGLQLRDHFRDLGYRIIDRSETEQGLGCLSFAFWKC